MTVNCNKQPFSKNCFNKWPQLSINYFKNVHSAISEVRVNLSISLTQYLFSSLTDLINFCVFFIICRSRRNYLQSRIWLDNLQRTRFISFIQAQSQVISAVVFRSLDIGLTQSNGWGSKCWIIIIKDQLQGKKSHKKYIQNIQIHKNMKKSQPTSTKTSTKKLTTTQQPQPQKQPQTQPQPKPSTTKHQNMKEFKVQIDHEIAKCLDTLNRQGLKYLKETLKNSNVFNEEIKEIINAEKSREKRKLSKSPTKNKKHDQIEQEIVEEYETFMEDQDEPSNQKTKLGPNPTYPLKQQKIIPLKLEKFQDKIQQPLKPFAIRSGSRQASRPYLQETKPVDKRIIERQEQEQQIIDKKQIDEIVQKISHLPEQKLKKVGRFIQSLQKSQKLEEQQFLNLKQTRPYLFKPQDQVEMSNPSNMMKSSAVNKGKKIQKATSLYNSIMKGSKKNSPIPQKQQNQPHYSQHGDQTFQNDNEINEQIPEVQQENKPNHPKIMDIPDHLIKPAQQYIQQEQKPAIQQKKVEEKTNESVGKRNDSGLIKKGSFVKNFPISNIKKPLDIEVTQSHHADTFQINQGLNQSKMVRLGKKKLGTNKVKIILLRNRGHPSIIGLTGIEFYNTNGKLIPILLQNIKSQSPKLLKLFNGIHQTVNQQQMFTTVFKRDYEIQLQIPEKIGGMKIWNYNKSEIQSSKQTDWIELYINDRLIWEGYIQKGSYNQITEYCTEAVIEPGFDFNFIKKQSSGSDRKIDQMSETPSSNQNIKIQGGGVSALSLGKKGENRDNKKVDWLEKTIMEENIKKILEQDQKKQEIQSKKTIFKPTRFSQIYQQEDKPAKLTESNQKFYNTASAKKKQESLQKNIQIDPIKQINSQKPSINPTTQRTNRSASQKMEEQKDIFSMFGQSLIKQKMKANQINSKVNQMSEKIDKLKETYRKEAQLGYSSLIMKQEPVQQKPIPKIQIKEIKEKRTYEKQSLDDFMNDSLFQEPAPRNDKKVKQIQPFNTQRAQNSTSHQKNFNKKPEVQKNQKVDIDDFLNELNDLVGSKQNKKKFGNNGKQKNVIIPELPKGNKLQITLLSNWGDQQSIGLNKIQFFDHQGARVFPTEAKSGGSNSVTTIFSQNKGYITELASQWKSNKKQEIKLQLTFSKKVELSLIRIWNYIGDRVHAMIGVRKIQLIFDSSLIFVGDIRKNGGTSRDQIFKSCENVLFTNNVQIHKRIIENDWLIQQLNSQRQQTVIFKKTIQNFMRPQTNCLTGQKQLKMVENKQGFKLPKRNCFQYDPPSLPSGHYLKFILHTTWGDRDFIGLNSIIVYDEKGQEITDIKKISQFPAPLITLAGYQKDKRILTNLLDGKNLTSNDESIWLAPYLQDIDKMQKQAENAILIQFDKCCTFSAINIYNYVKTPKRGVRQIEIHVDNYLIYRGYLRMANTQTGEILTTINFTKQAPLLQKIGYVGYNEDNLGQEVLFYNEGKIQKPIF